MVISQPPGNNPSYYYRASPTLPQLLWNASRDTLCSTCNYNIRVTHRNKSGGYFLHESDPRRDHQQIVLYSFCRPMRLPLHLAVKNITSNLSVWRFEHVGFHTSGRLYFPPECQQDRTFVMQPILLSENIPNIWHKSSNKTQGGQDQIEMIKTIMQTTRPRITYGRFYQWAQVAIF